MKIKTGLKITMVASFIAAILVHPIFMIPMILSIVGLAFYKFKSLQNKS